VAGRSTCRCVCVCKHGRGEEGERRLAMRDADEKVVRLIRHFSLSETSGCEEMGMMIHLCGSGSLTSTEAAAVDRE